jgi:ornithine cyclodeaminase
MYKKSVQQAVEHADIICTVTSLKRTCAKGDWIAARTHINAVGSSTAGARELDTAT